MPHGWPSFVVPWPYGPLGGSIGHILAFSMPAFFSVAFISGSRAGWWYHMPTLFWRYCAHQLFQS